MIPTDRDGRFSVPLALLIAFGIAAFFALKAYSGTLAHLTFALDSDPDSNMRLQQVRDLLAGQNWYDLVMRRYGLDGGTNMHWSRLADIGPAALLLAFRPFMSVEQSEAAMSIIYPLLLIIPYVVALIWTTQRLAEGRTTLLVGCAIALVSFPLAMNWVHFSPGNIDHHNLQIIAMVVFLGACCGKRDYRSGLIGSAALVLGLVIGLDAMPEVAAALLGLGIVWLTDPKKEADFLKGLGVGTCVLTLLTAGIFIPRPMSTAWCDSWTIPFSTIIFGLGCFLVLAAYLGTKTQNRLVLAALSGTAGLLILGSALIVFPACQNPLPLNNPLIERYWMASIPENQTIWTLISVEPVKGLAILPAIFASLACLISLKNGWFDSKKSLPLLCAAVASIGFGCLYFRGVPVMTAVLVPILAATFAQAMFHTSNGSERVRVWLALFPLVSLGLAAVWLQKVSQPQEVTQISANQNASSQGHAKSVEKSDFCFNDKSFLAINQLPPGKIISTFAQTELLMRHTKLQVAFAGYHRDYKSNVEIMQWLIGQPDAAHAAFKNHGVRYLSVCDVTGQFPLMAMDHPQSLMGLTMANHPPAWLVPILKVEDGGMIYEVR